MMKTEPLKELVAGLDLQTDLWWLAMILTGFLSTFLAAFGFPGAGSFFVWLAVLVRLAIVAGVSQQPYGAIFVRLLPFGLAAGLFAIFGDHMLVNWTERGQRVYPENTGVLLSSPLYIPLFWACLVIEFGYTIIRIYGLVARHASLRATCRSTSRWCPAASSRRSGRPARISGRSRRTGGPISPAR